MSSLDAGTQVVELVRSLALAWKNLAAYPPGHPALAGALDQAKMRLDELRGPASDVVLGIAADGLMYGEEKVSAAYVQKFALALYSRGVALLRFDAATTPSDIETFLRLLRMRPAAEEKRALWDELQAASVVNIHLQPVDYSAVKVTDSLGEEPAKGAEPESLWEAILAALLAGREMKPNGANLRAAGVRSVDELAAMILQYAGSAPEGISNDPDATTTFGVRGPAAQAMEMLHETIVQVAGATRTYVAGVAGLRRQVAVQQVRQLLRALPERFRSAILKGVAGILATDDTAGDLLHDLFSGMAREEVLRALTGLQKTTKLSAHAMNLLESLSLVAPEKREAKLEQGKVDAEVLSLFGEEDVDRFNPPDHQALLEHMSVHVLHSFGPERPIQDLGDRVDTVTDEALRHQLLPTLLALLATREGSQSIEPLLSRVEALFREYADAGHYGDACECIRRLREVQTATQRKDLREAIDASLRRIGDSEGIRQLIDAVATAEPESKEELQRLTQLLGRAATESLLLALTEEDNRSRRRHLYDFAVSLGPLIVPDATAFLSDSRWFVQRNMIVLLRAVDDRTSLPEIRRCAHHPDLRVRLEAIKTLLAFDPALPHDLLDNAINDPDPKLAEAAIGLVGSYGIREGVGPLLRILDGRDIFARRRQLRLRAIHALGELGDPSALARMERFFVDPFLPWPVKEERRAAFESLATYDEAARAPLVERGSKSRDPAIREICRQLGGGRADR